jgi:hypothetical protein
MSSLIPLIIQIIAGAIGGQAVGSAAKNVSHAAGIQIRHERPRKRQMIVRAAPWP